MMLEILTDANGTVLVDSTQHIKYIIGIHTI